ncbi:MAG: hypothetical protein JOZ15_02620, partial [Acidobacteria bacterium]|nr:hypothetical protein [Acidobacteriota bacterium]
MLRVKSCGLSDVGLTRVHNADYFEIDPRHRLYVVADGMGGHSAGEVAAQIAVKAIHDFIAKSVERDAAWTLRIPHAQPHTQPQPAVTPPPAAAAAVAAPSQGPPGGDGGGRNADGGGRGGRGDQGAPGTPGAAGAPVAAAAAEPSAA